MSRRFPEHCEAPAAGFALTECLVALLLFSIAMAGTVTAQLAALRATKGAIDHQRATRLLSDLAAEDAWFAHVPAVGAGRVALPLHAGGPPALAAWLEANAHRSRGLSAATLCLEREPAFVRLALGWSSATGGDGVAGRCGERRRAVALLEPAP